MAGGITDKFLFGIVVFLTLQFNVCLSRMLEPNLRIAAFNLKVFGDAKGEKSDVVDILVKIIKQYDITIVQEIRDSDGSAFLDLMDQINSPLAEYGSEISGRLGSTNSKEQYGMIYKNATVTAVDTYQFPDPDNTFFERPPFAFKVRLTKADEVEEMAIIAIHTKPKAAVEEIDKLVDVHQNTSDHWGGLKNILIAGDFNAGCTYVTENEMKNISLRNDPQYTWLIGDDVDTTTYDTDCAYDRFVVAGDELKAAVVPGSARAFRFDVEYNLDETQTKAVSDHYPIDFEIRGKVNRTELDNFLSETSMSFQDNTRHNKSQVSKITRTNNFKNLGFIISYEMSSNTRTHAMASINNKTKSEILEKVATIRNEGSPLVTQSVCELIKLYLDSPIMNGIPGAHGFLVSYSPMTYSLLISCEWAEDYRCSFTLTRSVVTIDSYT